MLDVQRIERFVSGDPKVAEEAFSSVSEEVKRFLWSYLSTLLPNEEDRVDAISVVLERLWNHRSKLEVRGMGGWWAFVAKSARWCALDMLGKFEKAGSLNEEIPVEDLDLIDVVAELCGCRSLMYQAADELWLGIEPAMPAVERKRRLLAAQLYYLHGRRWEEVVVFVGFPDPVSREAMDAWLGDEAVLHELAYSSLHKQNGSIAGHVLRPQKPLNDTELADWYKASKEQTGTPPEGWAWIEIQIAILKYRNGLTESKVSQIVGLSSTDLESAFAKCRKHIPFSSIAASLIRSLAAKQVPVAPLKSPGTWKRLVFQYNAANDLPHKNIVELLGPAASSAEYSLTPGMLNVWLSNGRLFVQLANYIRTGAKN